jgi:hypothetical protein
LPICSLPGKTAEERPTCHRLSYARGVDEAKPERPDTQREQLPWRGVAGFAGAFAFVFGVVWVWMRSEERDCDWECFNFPALVLLLVLAILVLMCLVILVGMLGVSLWRARNRSHDA